MFLLSLAILHMNTTRVGIGQNGGGMGYSAYRSAKVGEVGNFTDFIPTIYVSTVIVTVTAKSVGGDCWASRSPRRSTTYRHSPRQKTVAHGHHAALWTLTRQLCHPQR
jgi:hypothetical protein